MKSNNDTSCGSLSFSVQPEKDEERHYAKFTVVDDVNKKGCEGASGCENRKEPDMGSGTATYVMQPEQVFMNAYPTQTVPPSVVENNKSADESVQRMMVKSDISKLASMQKLHFEFLQNGYVQIRMELFAGNRKGLVNFRLKEKPKMLCCTGETMRVLAICIIRQDGAEVKLLLRDSEFSARIVNRKFDSLGIRLGYGNKKEREMRTLFVADLMTIAENVVLPKNHGWHKDVAGKWEYSFPDEFTWTGVMVNA